VPFFLETARFRKAASSSSREIRSSDASKLFRHCDQRFQQVFFKNPAADFTFSASRPSEDFIKRSDLRTYFPRLNVSRMRSATPQMKLTISL
jgi:hypothetical protein